MIEKKINWNIRNENQFFFRLLKNISLSSQTQNKLLNHFHNVLCTQIWIFFKYPFKSQMFYQKFLCWRDAKCFRWVLLWNNFTSSLSTVCFCNHYDYDEVYDQKICQIYWVIVNVHEDEELNGQKWTLNIREHIRLY